MLTCVAFSKIFAQKFNCIIFVLCETDLNFVKETGKDESQSISSASFQIHTSSQSSQSSARMYITWGFKIS